MEKKKLSSRHWLLIVIIVAVFIIYGFVWGEGNFRTVSDQWAEKIMDLPDFATVDLNGNSFTKEDTKAYDLTYLYVWTSATETDNLDELNQVAAALEGSNIAVIGLIADEDDALTKAQEIVRAKALTFPQLLPDDALRETLLPVITLYPTAFLINKEGDIVGGTVVSPRDSDEVLNIIETAVKAQEAD